MANVPVFDATPRPAELDTTPRPAELSDQDREDLRIQYEQAFSHLRYLDSSYVQITLLYLALVGAYIANYRVIRGEQGTPTAWIMAGGVSLFGICVWGMIFRTRQLLDEQRENILRIAERLKLANAVSLELNLHGVTGSVRGIKTSTYFQAIIVIMSSVAVGLTLMK